MVIVVIAGYAYVSSMKERDVRPEEEVASETRDAAPVQATGESVVIRMDNGVFEPDTITIKRGTQVVFESVGSESHWPASNLHPTHGIFPEFDSKRRVAPGESWSFVFDRVGEWRFHDHLSPRMLGTIVVTE